MENIVRPLIALGLGVVLGVGGHAAFQTVAHSPASAPAKTAVAATEVAKSDTPGARVLGAAGQDQVAGESKAYAEGQAAAREDGATLLAKLSAMSDGQERDDFVRGVFSAMAMKAPEEAMNLALQLDDPRLQNLAVKALAMEWAFDPSTLGSQSTLETAMFGAVVALASTNPEKAALLASTNLEGRTQQYAMMAVAKQWAQNDPEGALAWMGTLKEGENGRLAVVVAENVGRTDPQLAANYLDQIPDERSRQWSASRLAESWFAKDAKAAMEWAANVTDPAMRQRAVSSVASDWAEKDPQAAIAWAQSLGDAPTATSAVGAATREWAQKDPSAAASYATGLPAGDQRKTALASVASGWSRVDGAAAKQWAQALPVAEERDSAVQALRRSGRGDWGGNR